jgi:hypothetical protein
MNLVLHMSSFRQFSDFKTGNFDSESQKSSMFLNRHKYEAEVKTVLSKMTRALALIEIRDPADSRLPRLSADLEEITQKFKAMVFWEDEKETKELSDTEWLQKMKSNELQLKKLMTVSKSKFYMLKVNYKQIF